MGAGVLATPRTDRTGEFRELLASLRSSDVLTTVIRTSVFMGAAPARSLHVQRLGLPRRRHAVLIQNQ